MAMHVAIVDGRYVEPILSGRKTVECRLTRTARAPFGAVTPGQRIYLKQSSGPFFATAIVDAVYMRSSLNAKAVDALRRAHDEQILGDPAFWRQRRKVARYATLIWLRDVQPTEQGPRYQRRHMVAWYVLDDDAMPTAAPHGSPKRDRTSAAFEVTLTAGAVRNGYVSLNGSHGRVDVACIAPNANEPATKKLRLDLRDGPTIETDIVASGRRSTGPRSSASGGRFRWRGWAGWFKRCGVRAGDRLRFVPRGPRHFCVEAVRTPGETSA